MKDFSKYWNAISFAFIKYGDLKRKSGEIPYVVHPIRITAILRAAGYNEFDHDDLMIAALFHDLLEDTDTNVKEIEDQFGTEVGSIVMELTKPEGAKGREKDSWLNNFVENSKEAKTIKLADRIDNLLDMKDIWDVEKQKSYTHQAKIVLKSCGDANNLLAERLDELIKQIIRNL